MNNMVGTLILVAAIGCTAACSERQAPGAAADPAAGAAAERVAATIPLRVYKSPTCGCCGDWMQHLEASGFAATAQHPEDLEALKSERGVPADLRSCHTAVSEGGYVFEGHVPARYIRQFLQDPPADAIGLSVPGMPVGSPGMEHEGQFTPYQVVLLKRDGGRQVYATLQRYEDQF